jgi:hypothetical protein
MIPLWLRIRVEEGGRSRLSLPIPLFLAWLLLAALLLLLLPLVLLAGLLSWPWGWGRTIILAYVQVFVLIGSLSGLKLDIESREQDKITRIVMQ